MLLNRNANCSKGCSWLSYLVIIAVVAIAIYGGRNLIMDKVNSKLNAKINSVVEEYIANNPKALINSLQKMQEREYEDMMQQAQAKVKSNLNALQGKDQAFKPSTGNKDADITIVAFLDYRCGYCKSSNATLKEILASDPNVQVVFKELPVLGPQSQKLAQMALAVYSIDNSKYIAFHNAVMDAPNINDAGLDAILKQLGLDPVKVNEEMKSAQVTSELENVMNLAQQLDIRGTPAFVINETLIPGAIDTNSMQELIKKERASKINAEANGQKN